MITRKTLNLEKTIANKNPQLPRFIPGFLLRYLKRIIHVDEMNRGLYMMRSLIGLDFIKAALELLQVDIRVTGIENLPETGRYIVVANHPLGGLDGMALISVMGTLRRDIVVPVNDILMNVPNVRERVVHVEASTPRSFKHYTHHPAGASFGTKFEGLAVSRALPQQIEGLYHAGSVGIIMSGWLGAMNYGVIVANEVDSQLMNNCSRSTVAAEKAVAEDLAAG